jgi:hypothetical protein
MTGTPHLDQIVASGTPALGRRNRIECHDGFSLSVIAGAFCYSTPRPGLEGVASGYPGPYTAVEVGFPSDRPEPWTGVDGWADFAENVDDPTRTVYSYVPVEMVRALILAHGGEQTGGAS